LIPLSDTRERAELVHQRAYGAMTGEERYRLGVEMSDNARDIALEGLRQKYPANSQKALMRVFLELVMGWRLSPPVRNALRK
jgi:hypothetical protein